jgi:hypothetical protein
MQNEPFGAKDLEMLAKVLEQTISTVSTQTGQLVDGELHELGSRVGSLLIKLYAAGERDPEALKTAVLQSINRPGP